MVTQGLEYRGFGNPNAPIKKASQSSDCAKVLVLRVCEFQNPLCLQNLCGILHFFRGNLMRVA